MNTAPVLTVGAIPWYKSPQQLGLIATAISAMIAIYPAAGKFLGLSAPGAAEAAAATVGAFLTLIIPIIGGIARMFSKVQPLTATQAQADVHPATIAATIAAQAAGVPYATPTPANVSFSPKP